MKTVCQQNMCAGCGACVDSCPKNAVNLIENIKEYNAVIDESLCINCDKCHKVCPKNNHDSLLMPISWYQGWALDENVRKKGSSGGLATALALAFINNGGTVCTCKLLNGCFGFHFIKTKEELLSSAGSKYVKSNPLGVYKEIKNKINSGEKVLFIGLPCQVSAVKNYALNAKVENLYTIDLICHGTPSQKLLEKHIEKYKVGIDKVNDFKFRDKTNFTLFVDGKEFNKGVQDNYVTAFLTSLSYTENCYSCDYAQIKRASDITLGDSWNSDLPVEEVKKGVSLILCQTKKGQELIDSAQVELRGVDLNRAIDANHQLKHPSIKPIKRELFLDKINKGYSFNRAMFLINPKLECKKIIKRIVCRIKK